MLRGKREVIVKLVGADDVEREELDKGGLHKKVKVFYASGSGFREHLLTKFASRCSRSLTLHDDTHIQIPRQ